MPSLIDIFNPTFFMFLGILVLVVSLVVVYFETKIREQNHKMTSMLSLVTFMAEEMNGIKVSLSAPSSGGSLGVNLSQNQDNSSHNKKHIELIRVSSDEDDDDDDDDDDDSVSSGETDDSASESKYSNSDVEDLENNEIIEIGEFNDVKILKLHSLGTDTKPNKSEVEDLDDFDDDIHDSESETESELDLESDLESVKSEQNNGNTNNLDELVIQENIDALDFNFKSIDISASLDESKSAENLDYKKLSIGKLRNIIVQKGLVVDSSKLKKNEMLKLLGAE
jgi:hypothetical protein